MAVIGAIIEIFICFFCVIGLYFCVTRISDGFIKKNAPSKSLILIEECDEQNLEYLIRFYQSRIVNSDFDGLICGIAVGKSTGVDQAFVDRLNLEYGNIYFI